ncbi:LPS export ABC transporter periplasmic protein LptC [Candidatus Pelagibacter sp.]|jgi:LPS export ABC transporter protein LptC|nr:LPS export ABC transporter periplasmic protein LptC [Candidatus Pelagibacter sp.]
MNRKTVIQVLMFFFIFLISLLFYFKYFNKSPKNLQENIITTKTSNDKNSSSNYIDYINYISTDSKGNKYQITAKQAEIDLDNPDTMFLEDVIAYIFMKKSDTIKITSNFGKYNSQNYDTIFSKNVIITYPGHKITGDYSDFSFLKNLGTISTNVIYTGGKKDLFSDRIEINLTNKDTKIFMNDNSKKVLIKGTK